MRLKFTVLGVLVAFFVLAMNSGLQAVHTYQIDEVRNKGVLDSEDLQIIDDFVGQAVQELVNTGDFTSVAAARTVILSRRRSRLFENVNQGQYVEQFSESAYNHVSRAFEAAGELTLEDRKFKVMVNLLILVDGLEDGRLAELAIRMLKDDNKIIRYWAVHSITNAGITEQLNSSATMANPDLAERIVKQLKGLIKEASPEMIALMAEFAAEINIPQGEELLLAITDMRISKYADWSVEYELLDGSILRLLYGKMFSSMAGKTAVARRFAQLYSYVMQRYVEGAGFLSVAQKHQLASVLVETEKSYIVSLLDIPQSVIKRAVEGADYQALRREHRRLLGEGTRPGRLAVKLNFDYGKAPDGSKRTAPLTLPEPPITTASE